MDHELEREVLFRLDDLLRRVATLEREWGEHVAKREPRPCDVPPPSSRSKPAAVMAAADARFGEMLPNNSGGDVLANVAPIYSDAATEPSTDIRGGADAVPEPAAPAPASPAVSNPSLPLIGEVDPPAAERHANDISMKIPPRRSNTREGRPTGTNARHLASIERSIGARWYAGAGALIVVVGIALFIKLAFDRGWFHVAPAVRCVLGAIFGGGLIVVADIVRRRLIPLAAVGLYAAGLGSIFVSTYASYRLYALLEAPVTFALLAFVGLFGVAISMRAKLPSVAVLSLLAGFVTPFLFYDSPPRPMVLPAYTLTLLATGLCTTAWKGATFANLRRLAWWGTVVNGTIWLVSTDHTTIALGFLASVWAMVHAELAWSAVRGQLNIPAQGSLGRKAWNAYAWRSLLTSFSTSAWTLAFAIRELDTWAAVPTWLAPAALVAVTSLLACALAGFPRPFLEVPTNDRERLAACLVIQGAAALLATVALALAGIFEVFAWGLLSLTVLLAAKWLRARPFYTFALVSLAIATVRLVVFDSWNGTIAANPYDFWGLNLSLWTLCMMLAAGLWWTSARMIADEPMYAQRTVLPPMLAGAGCSIMLGSVALGASTQSLTYAWVIFATLFAIADLFDRRLAMLVHATLAGFAATLALFVAFPPLTWRDQESIVHPGLFAGLAVVTILAEVGALARRAPHRLVHSRVAFAFAAMVLFAITSLDVARLADRVSNDEAAQRSALSIWWALFAFGLIIVGFWRKLASPRRIGLALLGVAALKAIVLDLADVPPAWRVASFLGIGFLMLAVGVGYSKLTAVFDSKNE